jgi:predicted DNA-binding protein with PD1-like motif
VKYRREDNSYLVVLDKGDEITASLAKFVADEGLQGGVIRGIGGVRNITLGFFDTQRKEYLRKEFNGFYELAALIGDISLVDGKPFCHLHAVISDSDMNAFAGHLLGAEISVTCEITVTPGDPVHRKLNRQIGLNLLDI